MDLRLPTLFHPFSSFFPFVLSHTSRPDISNGTLYPSVYTFTGSLLIQILLMIFPCFPLRNPLLYPLPLHPTLVDSPFTSFLIIHFTPSLHRPLSVAARFA